MRSAVSAELRKTRTPSELQFCKMVFRGEVLFPTVGNTHLPREHPICGDNTMCSAKSRRIANQGTALGPFRLCQEPAGILSARGLQAFTANLLKACKRVLQRVFNLFC